MGNRRFAQISTSDEEDEAPRRSRSSSAESRPKRQRKSVKIIDEEDEEDAKEPSQTVEEDAKPIGDVVRVSGKGRGRRSHYSAFEYDGNQFELEDPVLLSPEDSSQKPYVAIIKDISQTRTGSLMVTGQWFYRPEEADKRGGGNWQSFDTRELFYSFHRDEVPAESVMHKCVVHFVPLNKKVPRRKEHPGFIVQRVYDTIERKLWKLTDKDYEDSKQHEIDLLVQKTRAQLGELLDIETEDPVIDQELLRKNKKNLRKINMSPLDVSRVEEAITRLDQNPKVETPGSCKPLEYHTILAKCKALTGETQRDKWLDRLLQGVQFLWNSAEYGRPNDHEKDLKRAESFRCPDGAVPAIAALEKAAHDTLSSDFQKYNQKMRQLEFNLKNSSLLATRLLNGELEPSKILNMSPIELKEGMTAEETAKDEPEQSERIQMTDARCDRCHEKKVGLIDIIQAGHGDRYQLECIACGHIWYASRDEASSLTIDEPSTRKSVGAAPWATAKFEDVQKKLVSPREPDKVADLVKKTTEPYMPVLETQKSFTKTKPGDNPAPTKNAE